MTRAVALLLLAGCATPGPIPPPVCPPCPSVAVCPPTKPCLADYDARWFAACLSGPTHGWEPTANAGTHAFGMLRWEVYWEMCEGLDFDGDGDVDLADYAKWTVK